MTREQLQAELNQYKLQSELELLTQENPERSEGYSDLNEDARKSFEFHGYFRAGTGINGHGDPMEAFKAPNAGTKYRLGNEAEAYFEATYKQNFLTKALIENKVDFYTVLTLAYFTPTVDNNAFSTTTSLREAYAGARGVWKAQDEALFWAGNRFYEHLDIHISDYFYRDMAGFGGGIEDVRIGDNMKWALAWLGGSIDNLDSSGTAYDNDFVFNKNTIDFRLYGIDTGIGKLQLTADFAAFSGDTLERIDEPDVLIDDSIGWAAGAFLNTEINDNLANRFTIQYGAGAADNFRAVITAPQGIDVNDPTLTYVNIDDTKRLRITDDIVINKGNSLSLQALIGYERYDNGANGNSSIDWVTIGARPVYHFNNYFSLAFEAGADYTNQDGGPEGVLGKFTLAPQIQPAAEHYSRPTVRAFFTYAVWSDQFEGLIAQTGYGDETQGLSVGVQVEAWW